ncbi:MAG: GAF domain-containing protein [Solirubrobacteraceae bacterium]
MATEQVHASAADGVRQALSKLRTATTLPELYDRATEALCTYCGFDRGVLFRLEGFEMIPRSVYFGGDREWEAEFRRIGEETPMRIDHDIVETEMISTRAPMLVLNAQSNRRGFKPLVEASRTLSYAAAPIAPENSIIGFLHADCYFAERDVTEHDRDVLGAFTEGLGYAIHRTALLGLTERQRAQSNRLRSSIHEVMRQVAGVEAALGPADDSSTAAVLTVPGFQISRREELILRLQSEGLADDAIAARLGIPADGLQWHLHRLQEKFKVSSPAEAVARWLALTS